MQRAIFLPLHRILIGSTLLLPLWIAAEPAFAQTAAQPAAGTARQIGTVKSVSGTALTIATDAGAAVDMTLSDNARIQQLAPGSTDLKTAQPATAADINAGDRILVMTKAADGGALSVTRVVLMKSAAIAQNNATRQADWQRRGSGGIVTAVDPTAGTVKVKSGAKEVAIQTSGKTIFRRYAPGTVKFEEATPSTVAALQPGDQLRVRGDKSADGTTISADEIVSGSFLNLAGTVTSVDAAAKTIVLKDLATKKDVTVAVGDESDLRMLPPEMAARFAARSGNTGNSAGHVSSGVAAGDKPANAAGERPTARPAGANPADGQQSASSGRDSAGAPEGGRSGQSTASGGDLSRVIERLPKTSLGELKPGEALMIVASGQAGSARVTAVTLLTGVEPLLAAAPRGGAGFNASNWNLGGGAGEAGGEAGGASPQR